MKRHSLTFLKGLVFILSLLFLIQIVALQAFAQTTNKWYVDKSAKGTNNGTSWENAWNSFSSINWNLIQPGNVIYISGGKDSVVYSGTLLVGASGTAGHLITITKGIESGHNGKVIINGENGVRYNIDVNGYEYLKIKGLYCTAGLRGVNVPSGCNVVYLDSLNITDYHDQAGIKANGWTADNSYSIDSLIITNCYISNTDYDAQLDNTYFQCVDNLIIEGCTFINNNIIYSSDGDYSDNIQTQNVGNSIISNNILINNSGHGDQGIIGNFSNNAITHAVSDVKIYNNLIVFPNNAPTTGRCLLTRYYDWYITSGLPHIEIMNNTIYGNNNVTGIALQLPATVKNNIVYCTTGYCLTQDNQAAYDTVNNVVGNLFYKPTGSGYIGGTWTSADGLTTANNPSISIWTGTLGGSTIITSNPLFNNIINLDFMLQSGSPAINAGVTLGSPYNVDRLGVSRLQAKWSIGAYEFSTGNTSSDNIAPNLSSIALVNSTTLELNFSEELETISAQTIQNYNVNNGITIKSALLSSDKRKVILTTTQHSTNQNYIVTVTGVKDIAGNIISLNNSAQYTFVENTAGNLKANAKVFLEGSYNGSLMTTALSDNEVIPDIQPYSTAPWNYTGSESFNAAPDLTVDWVLVELRNADDPAQVVSTRAGLLRSDGRIMEPDGTLGITFKNILYGSYYIAVRHRNHLAVMSSSPVLFSPDNDLYDFTTSLSKAFGQEGMIQDASSGVFMMYSGDGNGNGVIDDNDRSGVWSEQNGSMGYLNGDFNLDSGVTAKDVNDYWNDGKSTKVP